MYQEIVARHKKTEKIRCMILVPGCLLLAAGAFVMFSDGGLVDNLLRWGIAGLLVFLAVYEYLGYRHIDRDLNRMKQTVEASSDLEMSALLERCVNFDNTYFISDLYVLNFMTLCAYPRSQIRQVRCEDSPRTDSDNRVLGYTYIVKILYGAGEDDRFEFFSSEKRDAAYEALKN